MRSQPMHRGFSIPVSMSATKRILSVDDEPGILFTRQKLLENAGYEVLSAADGEQALHFFAAHDVDLVLLDYLMPGMDGGAVA
jgi:CheY-like chemotaxis protein